MKYHSIPLNSETQRERILIHLQGPVLSACLGKLTLCNEIFIASGNKQNNIF